MLGRYVRPTSLNLALRSGRVLLTAGLAAGFLLLGAAPSAGQLAPVTFPDTVV